MKRRRQLLGLWVCTIGTMGAAWGAAPLEDLAQRLQSADHVLLMRHADALGVGDPPGYNLQRCETQRNLNEEGRQQANRSGRWLRAQGVSQAQVYSSVWCRCQHTAEGLKLGPVRIEPSLNSFFDQSHRAPEQNLQLQVFIAQALKKRVRSR
ncbi:MAG: histidine phosphatase family protein [Alphaproteobacteria bacterium]|nr:histidine phosphatase family protein [Alphaproteobacteria bacterium]